MTGNRAPEDRPAIDYGIDAPAIRFGMAIAGAVGLVVLLADAFAGRAIGLPPMAVTLVGIVGALAASYGFFMAAYMTYSSRYGKLKTRDRLLDRVGERRPWTGAETVLDVGCGRGLLLVGAAHRLTTGRAVGIDLWRQEDQSNNAPEAAFANASAEGVADRIRIDTGDARQLPYPDHSFDVVLSHWVVHNLPEEQDRIQALDEMLRVLRPGGVIALADIEHVSAYCAHLNARGMLDIQFLDGGLEANIMALLSGRTYCPQALVAQAV